MTKIFIPSTADNCLSHLIKNGHDIEYQCLQGHCGSCRSRLLSGKIKYSEEPIAFLERDQFLPCCSSPATDITIEIGP